MKVGIYLVDDHDLIFREWDGSREDFHRRVESAQIVKLTLDEPEADPLDLAERVWALCNEHPRTAPDREQETIYRREHRARSLSVGDLVHLGDHGYYAVASFGFTRVAVPV